MSDRSSKKQRELLQFIDTFIKGNGYGPSYREIMRGLGYKSVSTVAVHVDGLIQKGYLRKRDHSARSIEVVTLRDEAAETPPKVGVVIAQPTVLALLEGEIERRLKEANDTSANEQIEVLIAAAEVLESKKAADYRSALTQS